MQGTREARHGWAESSQLAVPAPSPGVLVLSGPGGSGRVGASGAGRTGCSGALAAGGLEGPRGIPGWVEKLTAVMGSLPALQLGPQNTAPRSELSFLFFCSGSWPFAAEGRPSVSVFTSLGG
ncbi:unnamed protein product [Rangifer tarandus platyrhynchus]|uniref:Uncharacterized protein n=1 Tax=Rangifer tarandus platyrhynchus TaxID=3082113 RepID=A0ABN8ZR73_RANTA|nr:unnamed protein product [Rangifer tarandus platyrhynchus]